MWNCEDLDLGSFKQSIQNFLSLSLEIQIELWLPEQNILDQVQIKKNVKLKYYKLLNNSSISGELNRVVARTEGDFVFFGILGFNLIARIGSTNYYNTHSSPK
ncbi:hypothetical protein LEP1GSC170_6210 [Leptospira interrogans serovar Bataviae str. HAI135]|nr:hypothetical protein LEP1GSC170_6210 [Leptospira interrogans serovar Bataviae str. HAI135]